MCYVFTVDAQNSAKPKTVYIASDHGGFRLKNYIVSKLKPLGYQVRDFGPWKYNPDDDYPDTINGLLTSLSGLDSIRNNVYSLQKIAFEYTENMAKNYYFNYFSQLDLPNPMSRNENVVISHNGWKHLVEKKRSLNELITRFFALPRVPYLLLKTQNEPAYLKRAYQGFTEEYWIYQDIVEGVRIKVVLTSTNKDPVSFLSVMWKGSVETRGIEADETTKRGLSLAWKRRREFSTTEAVNIPQPHVLEEEYQTLTEKSITPSILICRNGVGVSTLANRLRGVRCALSWHPEHIKSARNDDDANCLAIPADHVTKELALETTLTFLQTPFSNEERHIRRLNKYGNTGNS